MNILFLDTASKDYSLALCSESKMKAHTTIRDHSDAAIVPEIEDALQKTGQSYADLTHLVGVIGPGGFTSLRVGVTTINTLAYSLKLPSTGVHLSDYWASRVRGTGSGSDRTLNRTPFLWLHSTRRTQLFVKGFGENDMTTPTALMELDDELRTLNGSYVGELIPEHQEVLKNCIPIPESELISLKEFLPVFLSNLSYREQQLSPWYGREG